MKRLASLIMAIALAPATSAFAADAGTELAVNTTERAWTGTNSELYRLSLPSPGILTVDLTTTAPERTAAKLDFAADVPQGVRILEQSATHLALAARAPLTLELRVDAEDPGQALGHYKLMTAVAAADVVEAIVDRMATDPTFAGQARASASRVLRLKGALGLLSGADPSWFELCGSGESVSPANE